MLVSLMLLQHKLVSSSNFTMDAVVYIAKLLIRLLLYSISYYRSRCKTQE